MISVALCTYNGAEYLAGQLESMAGQTLLPDELVVCDDCSSDQTINILEGFAAKVTFPVHIHRNQTNLGSTKNFENAIKKCRGGIIVLSDQDDIWKPNKLERLKAELDLHPEAGYVFSDAALTDPDLQLLGCSLWDSIGFQAELRSRFNCQEQLPILLDRNVVTGATMAFRSEIFERASPFPGNWVHDSWIAHIAAATGAPGRLIEEPLILYRQHATQQIGTKLDVVEKKKSLTGMYREHKVHHQTQFTDWEKRGQRIITLHDRLSNLAGCEPDLISKQTIDYLESFKGHFINRREILTTKHPRRYRLILCEALSGRYAQFSDSWRSIFRDLFL